MVTRIIFFSVFFIVHTGVNYYIFRRGTQALSGQDRGRKIYMVVISACYLCSFFGIFMARYFLDGTPVLIPLSQILYCTGSFWYGVMLYSFIFIFSIDVLRFFLFIFRIDIPFIRNNYQLVKQSLFFAALVVIMVILTIGFINARDFDITRIHLRIDRESPLKSLKIAFISDLHVNPITSRERVKAIVSRINGLDPDIVLLGGDIIDVGIEEFAYKELGEVFGKLKARYGIYAVAGNHEYFENINRVVEYLSKFKIIFLRDKTVKIDNAFYLIGREDLRSGVILNKEREPLEKLMSVIDGELPVILIDHQPLNLEEALDNEVDLQLSGHTHNGQMAPINLITDLIYEKSWGYLKKGDTHYYISCGIGTWGPPVRTGSVPEIVFIRLDFE